MAGSIFRFRLWFLGWRIVTRRLFFFRLRRFGRLRLAIHLVHAAVNARADPQEHCLSRLSNRILDGRSFGRPEPTQHVVGGIHVLARRSNPDSQPRIVRSAQVLLNAPQTLLAAVRTLRPRSQLAKW